MKTIFCSRKIPVWIFASILLVSGTLSCTRVQDPGQVSSLLEKIDQLDNESRRLCDAGDNEGAVEKLKAALALCEKIPQSEEFQEAHLSAIAAIENLIAMESNSNDPPKQVAGQGKIVGSAQGAAIGAIVGQKSDDDCDSSYTDDIGQQRQGVGMLIGKTTDNVHDAILEQMQNSEGCDDIGRNPRQKTIAWAPGQKATIDDAKRLFEECKNIMIQSADLDEALLKAQEAQLICRSLSTPESMDLKTACDAMVKVITVMILTERQDQIPSGAGGEIRTAKRDKERAIAMHESGNIDMDNGRIFSAIQKWIRAYSMFTTIENSKEYLAMCLTNIGAAQRDLGMYEDALQTLEIALSAQEAIPDSEIARSITLANIGTTLADIGMYRDATDRMLQGLALHENAKGSPRDRAGLLVNISASIWQMGNVNEGLQFTEKVLSILRNIEGVKKEQAICLMNLARMQSCARNCVVAIQSYEQSLKMLEELDGTKKQQGQCLAGIGDARMALGQISEAIVAYERAESISGMISSGLPLAYDRRGTYGDRSNAAKRFINIVEAIERRRSLLRAREYRLSLFEGLSNDHANFVDFLIGLERKGIVLEEKEILKWIVDQKSESAPLSSAFHYADAGKGRSLEDALREKAALKAARPDMKLLAEDRELSIRISKLSSIREPLDEVDEQRKELTEEIDSLQQRRNMIEVELKKTALGAYVAPDFRKPMEMAKELEADRAVLQYSIGEKEGWLLILTRDGITAHKLGAETPALPELYERQEATLDQLVDAWKERNDKIGLDGIVRLARARAEDFGKSENERRSPIDAQQEQSILARLAAVALPDSALAELRAKSIRRLLVIPDGSLHYVPFAMLRLKNEKDAGTHYLVEEFASSYVPAMTTLDTIRKQKKERESKRALERRPLLAFANPSYGDGTAPSVPTAVAMKDDMVTRMRSFRSESYGEAGLRLTSLPETEQEATRVASLFAPPKAYTTPAAPQPGDQSVIFTGQGASEDEVKQLLSASDDTSSPTQRRQWKYLLFSTHGLADTFNGMLSCLALASPSPDSSEDGFLQAQEVMNFELDTDLVMLSACQTGLGRLRGGEGLVGLSAAFFYAGAESVCASLWQVPSGPTTQLVPELFKRLEAGGADRAEALRQAQLSVMHQGQGPDGTPADYSSPFCWAAFVLTGEYI